MIVMDRVGGYLAYLALLEDARAFEDVTIVLRGEADAARIMELKARSGS